MLENLKDLFLDPPALEKKQMLLAHHVRLVARRLSHALFVYGGVGGLGKTRTVLKTLEEEEIEPILVNSHVTPLSLFGIFFKHREDDVILFDDVDGMYRSLQHLGLLRSALWGSPRVVTYHSSQLPEGLPNSFEFTSRVILCANVIPSRNDAFLAVLSRCDQFSLSATNGEVLELMRHVSRSGFHGITVEECEAVIDFMEQHADERQLSMRLLGPNLRKYKYAREELIDWRPMIKSQLETLGRKGEATKRLDCKSKDLQTLRAVLKKHPDSVKDQQEQWCKVTGKSRASFYRCLTRYRRETE